MRGSASCGYGPIGPESWPKLAVGQISSVNSLKPNACGVCVEVSTAQLPLELPMLHCLLMAQAMRMHGANVAACHNQSHG